MEGAGVRRAVPEEAEDDAIRPLEVFREGGAGGDRNVAGNDAGGAQVPPTDVRDMHGAAAAATVAGGLAEQLRHHGVPVRLALRLGFGHQIPHRAAVTVAAMGAGDQVAAGDGGDSARGHRLLARREVRGTLERTLAEQLIDALFELADLAHGAEVIRQLLAGVSTLSHRLGQRGLRQRREMGIGDHGTRLAPKTG